MYECPWCDDTGWADPWELGIASPPLTYCSDCLGAGLDDCPRCDGEGSVSEPVACPCQSSAPAGIGADRGDDAAAPLGIAATAA